MAGKYLSLSLRSMALHTTNATFGTEPNLSHLRRSNSFGFTTPLRAWLLNSVPSGLRHLQCNRVNGPLFPVGSAMFSRAAKL